jgi:hypothetical protein
MTTAFLVSFCIKDRKLSGDRATSCPLVQRTSDIPCRRLLKTKAEVGFSEVVHFLQPRIATTAASLIVVIGCETRSTAREILQGDFISAEGTICFRASVAGHCYGLPMDELVQSQHGLNVEDLFDRPGFNEQILDVRVGIPALDGVESVLLPYTHFSVLMRLDKRLAAVTALGIAGSKLMDLDRSGIQWRLDPRLRADQQTGENVYASNDIDRGHLVRRASAVWGDTQSEAARAT